MKYVKSFLWAFALCASAFVLGCEGSGEGTGGADDAGDGDDDDGSGEGAAGNGSTSGQGGASTSGGSTSAGKTASSSASTSPTSSTSSTGPSTTTGGSTSTGPACVAGMLDTPVPVDDCEDFAQYASGTVDPFSMLYAGGFSVADTGCALEPTVEIVSPSDLVVCQYLNCIFSDVTTITCPENTTFGVHPSSDAPGCCGSGTFTVDYDCEGVIDDTVVADYIVQPLGYCADFAYQVSF